MDLLDLVAGGEEKSITLDVLIKWEDLIIYAVSYMRSNYENRFIRKDDPVRVYYKSCWQKIASAETDEELIEALEYLRLSIKHD